MALTTVSGTLVLTAIVHVLCFWVSKLRGFIHWRFITIQIDKPSAEMETIGTIV